jgi:signal transduction histidine kinase
MPANDPMDPSKAKLVRDLASQAGLVLRNARLIEDLRDSRRRIVAAQDARAKALERNIHDGAQQQLVALNVQLGLAKTMAPRDTEATVRLLGELQERTEETLVDLRDLARGIYPPLLADKGLSAALEAQARRSVVPVRVDADGIGRFSQEAESAVYFSVLEALQNVAKYAGASRATVTLSNGSGTLDFEVADDGVGFDAARTTYGTGLQGMADRLAALGGSLSVRSTPKAGTTVHGTVPVSTAAT